jgi:hypothetical protein
MIEVERWMVRISWFLCVAVVAGSASWGCDRQGASQAESNESSSPDASPTTPSEIPSDQTTSGATRRGTYHVVVEPEPNPIPFQQLFEATVRVYESESQTTLVDGATLDQVRAVMPAHEHGMKTKPTWKQVEPGVFRVRGMKFHMQGAGQDGLWVVHVLVNGPDGVDEASFDVHCCRP